MRIYAVRKMQEASCDVCVYVWLSNHENCRAKLLFSKLRNTREIIEEIFARLG